MYYSVKVIGKVPVLNEAPRHEDLLE